MSTPRSTIQGPKFKSLGVAGSTAFIDCWVADQDAEAALPRRPTDRPLPSIKPLTNVKRGTSFSLRLTPTIEDLPALEGNILRV